MKVKIGVRSYSGDTKADIARAALDAGHSVSEISKAVPMAYSQVHSLAKKADHAAVREKVTKAFAGRSPKTFSQFDTQRAAQEAAYEVAEDHNARRRATAKALLGIKPAVPKVHRPQAEKAVVWKGTCGNCGRAIEARLVAGQNTFIHTNVDPDVFIKETQFCMAFPKGLI